MMRTVIGMTIFLLLSCPAIAEAEYQAVAEDIAQQGRNKVRFKEETVAFYLDEPLLSEGTMKFDPPDKLTKIIEQPEYIKQQISGDEVLEGPFPRSFAAGGGGVVGGHFTPGCIQVYECLTGKGLAHSAEGL